MKSTIGRGVLVLTISGIVCKVIGAFFRLPLSHVLGVEGIGVFQLVMSVYSFALVLISGGLSVTLSKLVSAERARRNYGKIKWYIYVALSYCLIVSFLFGVAFLFLSKQMALLQNSVEASLSYKLFMPLLIFSSLASLYRGVYQGYENMIPTALSQVAEQVCKFVFGLLFAHYFGKFSLAGGVAGAMFGILLGEFLAFVYLFLSKHSLKLRKYKYAIGERREFFSYFFPATLGLAVSSSVHFVDSLLIVNRLAVAGFTRDKATSLFGLQSGIVGSILNFPVVISLAVSTALLPNLAYSKSKNSAEREKRIKTSFSLMWLCILPITLGLYAVSYPLYKVVYPFLGQDMFLIAVRLTAIGSVSTILLAVSQFLITILQARGDFKYVFFTQAIGGVAKTLCTVLLCAIPSINIYGLTIGNVVYSLIIVVLSLVKVKISSLVDLNSFFIPLLSSLVMLAGAGFISTFIQNPYISLIACVSVGIVIYLVLSFPLILRFKSLLIGKKKAGGIDEQRGAN